MRNKSVNVVKKIVNKYTADTWENILYYAHGTSKNVASPFYELLAFLYLSHGGDDVNVINILQEKSSYRKGRLSDEEEKILIANYKDAVEYICDNYDNRDLNTPISTQPKELTSYIASFFKTDADYVIYNPFAALGSYPVSIQRASFVGEESDPNQWAVTMVRLHANNISCDIQCASSRERLKDLSSQYHCIVTTLPSSLADYPYEEMVADLYNKLDDQGEMAIVVPASFLVDSKALAVRKRMVEENILQAVVLLPNKIFISPNHMLEEQYETGSALLFICKSRSKEEYNVFMADASFAIKNDGHFKGFRFDSEAFEFALENQEDRFFFGRCVSTEEILQKKHLNPKLFLQNEQNEWKDGKKLDEIATFIQRERVKKDSECKIIHSSDLSYEFPRTSISTSRIRKRRMLSGAYCAIVAPCLLLQINEGSVQVGFVDSTEEELYVSEHMYMLAPKEGISLRYLALVLLQEDVKKQLSALSIGSAISFVQRSDLKDIIVPSHSDIEREELVREALENSMTEAEKEKEELHNAYEKEIHARKHAITQNLSGFSALWNVLMMFRNVHNGQLNDSDQISITHPLSVRDIFQTLDSRLKTLVMQTENLAQVEYNWGPCGDIDPQKFISEYVRNHWSTDFQMVFEGKNNYAVDELISPFDGEVILSKGDAIATFEFPAKALERVLDNIISNAVSHGFANQATLKNKIKFDWYTEKTNCIMTIANNGVAIKDGEEIKHIFTYGYSTVLNQKNRLSGHKHSGIGAYDSKNILDKFGAKIEIISTPNEEYTVTYKITFTKTNIIGSM